MLTIYNNSYAYVVGLSAIRAAWLRKKKGVSTLSNAACTVAGTILKTGFVCVKYVTHGCH